MFLITVQVHGCRSRPQPSSYCPSEIEKEAKDAPDVLHFQVSIKDIREGGCGSGSMRVRQRVRLTCNHGAINVSCINQFDCLFLWKKIEQMQVVLMQLMLIKTRTHIFNSVSILLTRNKWSWSLLFECSIKSQLTVTY